MPEEVLLPFLISEVAEEMQIQKKDVKEVIEMFFDIIAEELAEGNTVKIGSYCKFGFAISPAVKKGTPVRNPATGETMPSAGRPARLRVNATPLSKLKRGAPGPSTKAGKELLRLKLAARTPRAA
jgi:nucleoid DNA-binding protein